jgi:hypothetical protein
MSVFKPDRQFIVVPEYPAEFQSDIVGGRTRTAHSQDLAFNSLDTRLARGAPTDVLRALGADVTSGVGSRRISKLFVTEPLKPILDAFDGFAVDRTSAIW